MSERTQQPKLSGTPQLALCCQFSEEPIKFRSTTAASLSRLSKKERLDKLGSICLRNGESLLAAFKYCRDHGIGGFRIISPIFPLKTHPEVGYEIDELPNCDQVIEVFKSAGRYAGAIGLRLTFHPDQFVILNSKRPDVVDNSLRELNYHAEVAEILGADVINIHAGAAYGDKRQSLERLKRNLGRLPDRVRERLTLENDDRTYTPADLLPLCRSEGVPLVYDVHHHRCNRDSLTVPEATDATLGVWNRTPVFHLSSPKAGWDGPKPERHHEFIEPQDFPEEWRNLWVTIEIEAKAKEKAVLALKSYLERSRR